MKKQLMGRISFYIKKASGLYEKILKDINSNINIVEIVTIDSNQPLLKSIVDDPTTAPTIKERYNKYIDSNITKVAIQLKDHEHDKILSILNNKTGIDALKVTRLENTHANAVIINHDTKKIYYFEPHISKKYNDPYDSIISLIQPLIDNGYTLYSTDTCPSGLQNITGDTLCRSWSLFGSLLFVLNPDKDIRELLDYFIGQRYNVLGTLSIFFYYIYKTYNIDVSMLETVTNKTLSDDTNVLVDIDQLINKSIGNTSDYDSIIMLYTISNVNNKILDILLKTIKKVDKTPLDLRIHDSINEYSSDIRVLINHIINGEIDQNAMTEYLYGIISSNFDTELYEKIINKKKQKLEKNCILF